MPDDLDDTIRDNAQGPKRAKGDAGEMEQHSLKDQIAADRHLGAKDATKSKTRGLKFNKLTPPGTV